MRRVLYALVPTALGAVYYFGWRTLAMILVANVAAYVTEWLFCRKRGEAVTEAAFVTGTIYALILPPTTPWHVLIIGIVFAIVFSKEVFGGFGRNFFNPAMVGRCFVYISFAVPLTAMWAPPAQGPFGALDRWSTVDSPAAITGATPMAYIKSGALVPTWDEQAADVIPYPLAEEDTPYHVHKLALWRNLFLGRISGTMGVTSAMLILIGGIYLFWTKTANRTTILTVIIAYAVFNELFTLFGVPRFYGFVAPLLGGGFLFGAFYMATDPVSSPKTHYGRIVYGIIIALGTVVIRNFSIFNGGLMFSILLGNMFAPIIDYGVNAWLQKRKARAAGKGAPA